MGCRAIGWMDSYIHSLFVIVTPRNVLELLPTKFLPDMTVRSEGRKGNINRRTVDKPSSCLVVRNRFNLNNNICIKYFILRLCSYVITNGSILRQLTSP
jgi:hypothetical protein